MPSHRAAAIAFACASLVLAGCHHAEKDPYQDWKAPALLEEGERLLRAGDLEGAEKILRRGEARAEQDRVRADAMRVFQVSLLFIAAANGNVSEPQKLELLTKMLELEENDAVLIFRRTKTGAAETAERLVGRGFACQQQHCAKNFAVFCHDMRDRLNVFLRDKQQMRFSSRKFRRDDHELAILK